MPCTVHMALSEIQGTKYYTATACMQRNTVYIYSSGLNGITLFEISLSYLGTGTSYSFPI